MRCCSNCLSVRTSSPTGCGAESISVRSSWSTGYSLKRASTMRKIFLECPVYVLRQKVNIDDAVYYYRTDNENSYNHNISEKNLLSYFKSTRRLIDFFEQNDTEHQYLRATEIGIVNAYRWAANAHVAFERWIKHSTISLRAASSASSSSSSKGVPVKRVNLIYLAYRKLYTLLISAPSAVS